LEKSNIFDLIKTQVDNIRQNKKAKPVEFLLRQVMAKMLDGSDSSIKGFDRLRQDEGYASQLELKKRGHGLLTYGQNVFFKKIQSA